MAPPASPALKPACLSEAPLGVDEWSDESEVSRLPLAGSPGCSTAGAEGAPMVDHDPHQHQQHVNPHQQQQQGLGISTEDLECPVCLQTLTSPFVTRCGHTFCSACLQQHLQRRSSCPECSAYLVEQHTWPNFLLSKLVGKAASRERDRVRRGGGGLSGSDSPPGGSPEDGQQAQLLGPGWQGEVGALGPAEVDALLVALWERKQAVERERAADNLHLLLGFLESSKRAKLEKLDQLRGELRTLDTDIACIEAPNVADPARLQQNAAAASAAPRLAALLPPPGHQGLPAVAPRGAPAGGLLLGGEPRQLPDPAGGRPSQAHPTAQDVAGARDVDMQLEGVERPAGAAANSHRAAAALPPSVQSHAQPSVPLHGSAARSTAAPPGGPPAAGEAAGASRQGAPGDPAQPSPGGGPSNHRELHIPGRAAAEALRQRSALARSPRGHGAPPGDGGRDRERSEGVEEELVDDEGLSASRSRKRRLLTHMTDLQTCYLTLRRGGQVTHALEGTAGAAGVTGAAGAAGTAGPACVAGAAGAAGVAAGGVGHPLTDGNRAPPLPHSAPCPMEVAPAAHAAASEQLPTASGQLPGEPPGAAAAAVLEQQQRQGQGQAAAGGSQAVAAPVRAVEGGRVGEQPQQQQQQVQLQGRSEGLVEFGKMLSALTRHSRLEVVAEMATTVRRPSAAIISAIEFDQDGNRFATAGVSKRIHVYDFGRALRGTGPAAVAGDLEAQQRLVSRSKISCIAWARTGTPALVSSDYEGCLLLWDVERGRAATDWEAHDLRIWAVDTCPSNGRQFISGSDDCTVKVWSASDQDPLTKLQLDANVCCVRYNPTVEHQVAVGCANQRVHLYDLRSTRQPLHSFQGHGRAVSYVRYAGPTELVSASTDSSLRLWDLQRLQDVRSFTGHENEKNFVGLSVEDDLYACGSELNEVVVYHKAITRPLARQAFTPPQPANCEAPPFISSVCWKPGTKQLVAANSQGTIKLLQLT